jgi:hypothetical protein
LLLSNCPLNFKTCKKKKNVSFVFHKEFILFKSHTGK